MMYVQHRINMQRWLARTSTHRSSVEVRHFQKNEPYSLLMEALTTYQPPVVRYIQEQATDSIEISSEQDQILALHAFFRFKITDWARIFSVTRPVIYAWMEGRAVPKADNAKKILYLYQLLREVPSLNAEDSLGIYAYHREDTLHASLVDLFSDLALLERHRQSVLEALTYLLAKSRIKRERDEENQKSGEGSDEMLEYNLRELGF